jgi:hypothetical protein
MSMFNETCVVLDLQPLKSLCKQTKQLTAIYDPQPNDLRKRIPVKRATEVKKLGFYVPVLPYNTSQTYERLKEDTFYI